jgi:hypothetical protein
LLELRSSIGGLVAAAAISIAGIHIFGAAAASAAGFAPHRATYALSQASGAGGSQILAVDGAMVFEWTDACDGWALNLKGQIILNLESGESESVDISQVTWEAKDGSKFRYFTRQSHGDTMEQTRGEATYDAASGNGELVADLPAKIETDLPAGTLFPSGHTNLLLKQAAAGEQVVVAKVFDGTVQTTPMDVSAVLGAGAKDWPGLRHDFPALKGLNSFPAGLAYYFTERPDGTPDAEQSLRLYENGVVGEITFDFGGIQIKGVLDKLDMLPAGGC